MLLELRRMTKPVLHLIAGPTASGKSALAMNIAKRERGTVINADAMQVYAGLPILTAQPEPEEKKEIPHELYEVFDPAERSSVGKWLALAEDAVKRAVESGRTPVLVGGTGLYFKALLEGLAEIPPVPESVREVARELYARLGSDAFRVELAKLDPESAAHLKPNDKQRLIRAFEVASHTGKPIAHWQSSSSSRTSAKNFTLRPRLLLPPREELYAACDRRFLAMMKRGAVDEVRTLLARKLDPDLPAMKILGVREIAAMLRGELSRETAIAKAQQATRNYAKRQMTWFRNQWADVRDQ
jgi:tRNA dimethylallyltransferase